MAALAKFLAFFAMVVGVFAVQSPHRCAAMNCTTAVRSCWRCRCPGGG